MKNLLIKVPEATAYSDLAKEITEVVSSVHGQWAVVGIPFGGEKILNCLVDDNFDSTAMLPTGWTLFGEWQWDGTAASATELSPVDPEFVNFMPNELTLDGEGAVVSSNAPTNVYEIHKWSGWPDLY